MRCCFCRVLLARRAVHRSGVVGCLRRDHPTKASPPNSGRARSAWTNHQATRSRIPIRRPSGGVAQGDEPHGCGERLKGPGTALVSRPPERHRSEGSLAAGQTRMPGALSLWLLSLSREQRESDSPCRAKSVVSAEESVAIPNRGSGKNVVCPRLLALFSSRRRRCQIARQSVQPPTRPHPAWLVSPGCDLEVLSDALGSSAPSPEHQR